MRRVRPLLLLAVVALVATGCFRSDLAVNVNDDGSGTITMVVAFNPEAYAQLAEGFGEDLGGEEVPTDPCAEIEASAETDTEALPEGASIEPYRDGDFCGVTLTASFSSIDELDEALGGLFSSSESQGLASFDSFTIEQDGDNWVFEATPSSASSAGTDTEMFGDLLEGASNVVRVKLPGTQVDHNADRIDADGTMIWNLDVLGDTRTLQARTEPGEPITDETFTDAGEEVAGSVGGATGGGGDDGGSSTVWIVLGVLVVAAAVVGFVLWQRNKSKAVPAIAGAPGATSTFGAGGYGPDAYGAPVGTPPATDPAPVSPPQGSAPPVAEQSAPAAGGPQWDAQRNAYIQWDAAGNRWMQYDDAAKQWKPIS